MIAFFLKRIFRYVENWLVNFTLFGLLGSESFSEDEIEDCKIRLVHRLEAGGHSTTPLLHGDDYVDAAEAEEMRLPSRHEKNNASDKNFGLIKFALHFLPDRSILGVTIIEAQDLPAMDSNGKSDPFIEVTVRPKQQKYKTSCKHGCLNPLFNESFDFSLTDSELQNSELEVKVKDQDFASEQLIGVIRLPLRLIGLSAKNKTFTCLIVNEVKKTNGNIDLMSAAKLNLKLSDQMARIRQLESELIEVKNQLKEVNKERDELWRKNIEHALECTSSDDSHNYLDIDTDPGMNSAPISQRSSPRPPLQSKRMSLSNSHDDKKVFELIGSMNAEIKKKDKRINQLEQCISVVNCHMFDAPFGQVEVGLTFFHVTSRLMIHIISASKLKRANIHNDQSDPFVKVKVYHNDKGKNQILSKFETDTKWRTLEPTWNEKFTVEHVKEEDLSKMYVEIVVFDRSRIRQHQPLGQLKLGAETGLSWEIHHWQEMLKLHGTEVVRAHPLREV